MNHLLASFILVLTVSAISLPVGAIDPKEEESGAAASRTIPAVGASSQAPLKNMFLQDLPFEIQCKILESLSPKEVSRIALTSRALGAGVSAFRDQCFEIYKNRVKAVMHTHESNPAGYGLPMFSTPKSAIERNIDSDILKYLLPRQVQQAIWTEFDIFAATPNNPIYEVAERMAGYQKANMADVMLAAMYSAEAPPSYLEKAAIHHLFSSYTVFHKEEGIAGWQQQVLPDKKEGLQQFIEKTYVEFDPGQVPAVRPDQKLVVKHSQLWHMNHSLRSQRGQVGPNYEVVLDVDEESETIHLDSLSKKVNKLAIINSGGLVRRIEDNFLYTVRHPPVLKTVMFSLPKVTEIGNNFLHRRPLETLILNLPHLTQIEDEFLSQNESLKTLMLCLPQLTGVGNKFLAECKNLENVTLILPKVRQIRSRFLTWGDNLKTLTLDLPKLEQTEIGFLSYKGSETPMEPVTLRFPRLTRAEDSFLSCCRTSFKTLTVELPEVIQVKKFFLGEALKLETLTLSLPKVTEIGDYFLFECRRLKNLKLELPEVTKIGQHFLACCGKGFESLKLELPEVVEIGDNFLWGCEQLRTVDLRSLLKLKEVKGDNFMHGIPNIEQILINARQEELFNELLKDKSDLLSKLVIA